MPNFASFTTFVLMSKLQTGTYSTRPYVVWDPESVEFGDSLESGEHFEGGWSNSGRGRAR